MPAPIDSKPASRRDGAAEPLRRKRVQPAPAATIQRRRLLNALLLFATVVLLVDALVGDRGLMERVRARKQLESMESALAALKYQNALKREEMRLLNEDRAYIESIAREELGLIKPGELLFIIRDAKSASTVN